MRGGKPTSVLLSSSSGKPSWFTLTSKDGRTWLLQRSFDALVEKHGGGQYKVRYGIFEDISTLGKPNDVLLPTTFFQRRIVDTPHARMVAAIGEMPLHQYREGIAQQIGLEEDAERIEQQQNMWRDTAVTAAEIVILSTVGWEYATYSLISFLVAYATQDFDGPYSWATDEVLTNLAEKLVVKRLFPMYGEVCITLTASLGVKAVRTTIEAAQGEGLSEARKIMLRIKAFSHLCHPELATGEQKATDTMRMQEINRR
jgi:hypothetical protein